MHVGTNGSAGETTVVYQAPDRFRTIDASGDSEMITIGRTVFARFGSLAPPSVPGVDAVPGPSGASVPMAETVPVGSFRRIQAPASGPGPVDGAFAQLRSLADAAQVQRDGAGFHWRAGSGKRAVSGDAHIDRGRIADFTFLPAAPASAGAPTTYRVTDYDAAPPVEPPPNEVVDEPALPPCASDGSLPPGGTICGATGPTTTTAVALPSPTVSGPSPLELRAVLSVQNGQCPPVTDDPAANGGLRLTGADGRCYDLGRALATIRRARVQPQALPDGMTVTVDLASTDAAAVRSALSGQVGRQFAMVMFHRVLSAPVVKDPSYTTDSIAIAPVDPQTAANIIKSLVG